MSQRSRRRESKPQSDAQVLGYARHCAERWERTLANKNGAASPRVDAAPSVALPASDVSTGDPVGKSGSGGVYPQPQPPVKVSGAPDTVVGAKLPQGPEPGPSSSERFQAVQPT